MLDDFQSVGRKLVSLDTSEIDCKGMRKHHPDKVLLIIGCEPSCGKTVLMTGLAAVLGDQGIAIRAVKPLGIGSHSTDSSEMRFIRAIAGTEVDYSIRALEFPPSLSDCDNLIHSAISTDTFTFVELPGSCATPIELNIESAGPDGYTWRSVSELASALGLPCLLVSRYSIDAFERIDLSYRYLIDRGVNVVALAAVETNRLDAQIMASRLSYDDFQVLVSLRVDAAFLGVLRYSDSVSVPGVKQGNLKKTIENDIDLLSLFKSANLPIV